jgi:U3 small nucleolar RNA-associated protein 6
MKEEITSIARKRSDFEHIINARGSKPSDYTRYIDFEKNVDALRRKRIKRLGVRSTGSGQRTIFFLYNRAVRKFSGDLDLWLQYIEFARREKAFKKLNEILTSVVRLHPTNPDIWIYAARFFMESQADITNARSYMQRGLRFCKSSKLLWIEYAKLETIYIGKIAGRRKVLGLDADRKEEQAEEELDADEIALPQITAEDVNPSLGQDESVDEVALSNLASAPVLTGAIPMAVFDSAMKQFNDDPALAEHFFDMLAEFDQLPCIGQILQHIVDHLHKTSPHAVSTIVCAFQLQLFGIHPSDPSFPQALQTSLNLLNAAITQNPKAKSRLSEVAIRRILLALRGFEELDEPALRKVLVSSLRKYCRSLEDATKSSGDAIVRLAEVLQEAGDAPDARILVGLTSKDWSTNERHVELQRALLDT